MAHPIEDLQQGSVINNKKLCEIFACSPQGGMRRSLKTNTLVIVSNHVKSIYDDRWEDDVLHYTGMGTKGNQSIDSTQNKTLAQSQNNGVSIHLFEVFVDQEYFYRGIVALCNDPYFERQPDERGMARDVCVFPLRLKSHSAPIDREYLSKAFSKKSKKAKRLTDNEVLDRAKNASTRTGFRTTSSKQYNRNPWVAEHAKRAAQGICQLCENPAPFKDEHGEPFLETHHIKWMAKGGMDTIENTIALCPNCHRRMHILNDASDIQLLITKKR